MRATQSRGTHADDALVDDKKPLMMVTAEMLSRLGYDPEPFSDLHSRSPRALVQLAHAEHVLGVASALQHEPRRGAVRLVHLGNARVVDGGEDHLVLALAGGARDGHTCGMTANALRASRCAASSPNSLSIGNGG
jgi:hypothetical protein